MIAGLVLIVGALLCALIVYFGPTTAEALLPMVGAESAPAAETVYALVIYGGLLLFGLVGGALTGVNAARMGRKPVSTIALGLVLGVIGVLVAAVYAELAGTLSRSQAEAQQAALLWGTILVLFQSASEEVYFRGWLQRVLSDRWSAPAGVVLAALTFAGLHVMGGARSPVTLINLFLGGMLFGVIAMYRHGIAGAIAAHFAWNWSEQILLGLMPNPGVGSFGAFYDLELTGASAWGGSDEGLNASVAMTLTLFALLVPLVILVRSRGEGATRSAASG